MPSTSSPLLKSAWLEVKKLGTDKNIPYLYFRWRQRDGSKRSRMIGSVVTMPDGTLEVFPPSKAPKWWKPGKKAGRPKKTIIRERV